MPLVVSWMTNEKYEERSQQEACLFGSQDRVVPSQSQIDLRRDVVFHFR